MNLVFILFFIISVTFLLQFSAAIGLTVKSPQKCFDVLDELPKNEVEKIYFMSFKNIAHSYPATDILDCFLRAAHPGDKSLNEQYFEVYKKCDVYRKDNFEPFGIQQLEELISLGLPYDLEIYLRKIMQIGNKMELEQGINHVQDVMSKDIELSQDYKDYKMFIAKKYKPNEQSCSAAQSGIAKPLAVTKLDSQDIKIVLAI